MLGSLRPQCGTTFSAALALIVMIIKPYNILILVILVFFSNQILGQNDRRTKNVVYYEIGGISFAPISVNYERLIGHGEKIHLSIGAGVAVTHYLNMPSTIEISGS
jgi:hypothetical protein